MEGSPNSSIVLKDSKPNSLGRRLWRFSRYAVLCMTANALIWGGMIYFLRSDRPVYRSVVVLNVAGGGPGVNVNLPGIGQAITNSKSSFSSAHSDPRDNYKELLMGGTLQNSAAEAMDISTGDLGQPKVNLVANTTLMTVEMEDYSAETAQNKTQAIYEALDQRLNDLRTGEQADRDKATTKALNVAQQKLTAAQRRLSRYKESSGLNSSDQVKDLISTIETLRKQRVEAIASQQRTREGLQALEQTLGVSSQQASDALTLQADQEFQKSLKEYTDAKILLLELRAIRGPNYPDVVATRGEQNNALNNLLERGKSLLGKPLEVDLLEYITLDETTGSSDGSGSNRGALFKDMVQQSSLLQGLSGEVKGITREIDNLETLLGKQTQKEAVLDGLLRDLQIAEAVFAATLTKIDLGRGDPFSSYPLLQLIEPPTLPTDSSSPKKKVVFASTLMASLLITLGLTLLWYRQPILRVSRKAMMGIVN